MTRTVTTQGRQLTEYHQAPPRNQEQSDATFTKNTQSEKRSTSTWQSSVSLIRTPKNRPRVSYSRETRLGVMDPRKMDEPRKGE